MKKNFIGRHRIVSIVLLPMFHMFGNNVCTGLKWQEMKICWNISAHAYHAILGVGNNLILATSC